MRFCLWTVRILYETQIKISIKILHKYYTKKAVYHTNATKENKYETIFEKMDAAIPLALDSGQFTGWIIITER